MKLGKSGKKAVALLERLRLYVMCAQHGIRYAFPLKHHAHVYVIVNKNVEEDRVATQT